MQILHRVSISATPEIRKELTALGIAVSEGLATFVVYESDASWPAISEWIKKHKAVDIVSTKFSRAEIAAASWFELVPTWQHGYPQPDEENSGYLEVTYDLSDYCRECGIGLKQKAPFRMKGEPVWGRNAVLQLNWIFDDFFAKPGIWQDVFRPYEVASRPVVDVIGHELETVTQLVPTADEMDVAVDELTAQTCQRCGRVKYLPATRGAFPRLTSEPSGHMFRTKQYFGSGAAAHKRVLVSKRLGDALDRSKVRGVSLRPVASASAEKKAQRGAR